MVSEVDPAGARAAPARYALAVPSSALLRASIAFLAGAALAAAFAPLNLWPLAIAAPATLMWLWQDARPGEAARLGFLFSFATFAAGTYWLYISIHGFGGAPLWVAFGLMLGLVSIMGLYQAALGYAVARWLPRGGAARYLLALPAAWLLVEWWRGWFLSGFSWLSLGYSQSDTWLAGFAPLAGVYGISALLLVCAGALTALLSGSTPRLRLAAGVTFLLPWLLGAALYRHSWTQPAGPAVSIAVVQGAIPQEQKWLDSNHDYTLQLYRRLTEQVLGKAALIVWPESATADLANDLVPYINSLYGEARAHGSALLMGILRAEQERDGQVRYYNSVLGLGDTVSWYDKHHLVPFAEFFPVPQFVRSWLRLMSLPYSDFTPGAVHQPPQPLAHLQLGTTVCYEDAYGSSMLYVLPRADVLVNVTNDAWFGHSSARHQHFQIARMRALEAGRYMIRAANDGISGVIGPHGEVIDRAAEFVPLALVEKVTPYAGLTPYAHLGNWLIVSLATLALAYGLWVRNDRGRRPQERSS